LPNPAEEWAQRLSGALNDPNRHSGFLQLAEDAVQACPGNGAILSLAAMAALLDREPDRALVFVKRFCKRYKPRATEHLLTALAPLQKKHRRRELEPFLRSMRRRLDRDRVRIHEYHQDLRLNALKRLAALAGAVNEKAEAERRRETQRVAAIEREYAAKIEDLRHNYALRVTVDWIQALEVFVPVHRYEVLIKRRKGERLVRLDWHAAVRLPELPVCEFGLGLDRTRLVCDERLHLTDASGQAPCPSCGKVWCRACAPGKCPRCPTTASFPAEEGRAQ
jgi:hypothetical protein